jgi:hypothetical protein
VNIVSGDYNRETGIVGNGSTKYLNSNRAANADPLDNNHSCVYVSSAATGALAMYIASTAGVIGDNFEIYKNSNDAIFRNRNGLTTATASGSGSQTGFIGMSRSASGSFSYRIGGATTSVNVTSSSANGRDVFVLARNNNGSAANFNDGRIVFYSIGESLTLSLLDSRVSTLYTAIGAAIP